mmetsp:Transcript_107428/g.245928  ORF Transcript_107428/g.245928 Transcript_107428/m.245928 type:complete len:215 (+) Transcript_107428:586-1230(+)
MPSPRGQLRHSQTLLPQHTNPLTTLPARCGPLRCRHALLSLWRMNHPMALPFSCAALRRRQTPLRQAEGQVTILQLPPPPNLWPQRQHRPNLGLLIQAARQQELPDSRGNLPSHSSLPKSFHRYERTARLRMPERPPRHVDRCGQAALQCGPLQGPALLQHSSSPRGCLQEQRIGQAQTHSSPWAHSRPRLWPTLQLLPRPPGNPECWEALHLP